MKEKIAKVIRILTVPPLLVIGLIWILTIKRPAIFRNKLDIALPIILLGIVPALAYPLQPIFPHYFNRPDKREGQRELAFVMSVIGYTLGILLGYLTHVTHDLQFIFNSYFLSLMFLVLFNTVFHIRASGHACSCTGPLLFLIFYIGSRAILPSVLIAAAVVFGSLTLKRHTPKDLLFGALSSVIAFFLTYLFMFTFSTPL